MTEPVYVLDEEKLQNSSFMISIYDSDLRIRFWNAPTEKKFNISAEEAIGKFLPELFPGYDKDFRYKAMKDVVNEQKSFYFPDLPYQYREGSYSQVMIPIKEGLAVISSDNDGSRTVARGVLLDAALRK